MVHMVESIALECRPLNSHELIRLHCVDIPLDWDHFGGKASEFELNSIFQLDQSICWQQYNFEKERKHLRIFRGLAVRCDDDDDETVAAAMTRIMMNKIKHFDVDVVILTRFMLCDNQIVTELEMFSSTL